MRNILFVFGQLTDEDVTWLTEAGEPRKLRTGTECIAPGFLDSGLTVFASTLPRPARRGRVVPERGFGSRTSPASSARCMSA